MRKFACFVVVFRVEGMLLACGRVGVGLGAVGVVVDVFLESFILFLLVAIHLLFRRRLVFLLWAIAEGAVAAGGVARGDSTAATACTADAAENTTHATTQAAKGAQDANHDGDAIGCMVAVGAEKLVDPFRKLYFHVIVPVIPTVIRTVGA